MTVTAPMEEEYPQPSQMQLLTLSKESDALVTLLRQYAILQIILSLQKVHHPKIQQLVRAAGEKEVMFGEGHAKSFSVHGSACFPPNLRASGDVDMTVVMGQGHDPESQEQSFSKLMATIAFGMILKDIKTLEQGDEFRRAIDTLDKDAITNLMMRFVQSHDWQTPSHNVVIADLSQPGYSQAIKDMKDEKAICMAYFQTLFQPSDVPKIKSELKEYFDYKDEDLAVLDTFDKSKIDAINAKRREKDPTYIPYHDDDYKDEALVVTTSVGLFAKDRLNIWNPVTTKGVMNNVDRSHTPLDTLTFSHPLEDTPDKFFAIFTKARAIVDEPHAKDLVDLYLRTKDSEMKFRGWAPVRHKHHDSLVDMIRVQWPAHAAFASSDLYFSRTDPSISKSVNQVSKGLLKLKEHGIITSQTFGETITEANADTYAEMLVKHAWDLAVETLGVERSGTQNNPVYHLKPSKPVEEYWDACRAVRDQVKHKLPKDQDDKRAKRIIDDICGKLDAMLQVDYVGQDRVNIRRAGATNAYLNADKSRSWIGLKGIS